MIAYILNFFKLCASLIYEDFVWLGDYMQTVSTGEFALLLLGIIVSIIFLKYIAWILEWLLSCIGCGDIIIELLRLWRVKELLKRPDKYCEGYSEGYRKGYHEGKWRWWNPFSWF